MAASRADGPRRLGRVVYQQGENPLYIPPLLRRPPAEWAAPTGSRTHPSPANRSRNTVFNTFP